MRFLKSKIIALSLILASVAIFGIGIQKTHATDIFYQIHQFIETPIIRLIANILVSKLNNRIASSILNVGYAGLDAVPDQSQDPDKTGSTGQVNDRCSSDSECSAPYICNANNVCGYSAGKGGVLDGCKSSADCATPLVCNPNAGVCGYSSGGKIAFGEKCSTTSDCTNPYVCNANSVCGYAPSTSSSSSSSSSKSGPSFITNWRNEILQTESRGNDIFRTLLSNTQFCPHLDSSIKSMFLADKYPGGSNYKSGSTAESSGTAGPGEACFRDGNCTEGNYCLGGICAPTTGAADNKPTGAQCKNNNECASGNCNAFICAVKSGNGKAGDRCTDSGFCGIGFICSSENVCVSDSASQKKNSTNGNAVLGLASSIASQLTPGGTTPFGLQTRCTLPSDFNLNTFNKDFSKGGGFEAWDKLLQDPQNNFVGALFITAGQQSIEQARTQKAEDQERLTSGGFTSKRDTGGTGGGLCGYSQKVFGRCLSKADVTTPAGILSVAAGQTITSSVQRMIEAHDWVDLVGALVEIVGQQIQNFGGNGANTPENIPAVKTGEEYTNYYPNDVAGNDGTKEYTDLNICLNSCATSGTTTCNEKDPTAQQTCINSAKLACYADCSSRTTGTKTQDQAQLGDTCENTDGTANQDICGTALFCAKDQTPKICLECSATIACTGGNKTCDQGVCVAQGGNKRGESCVTDNQCKTGLYCNDNNHCRPIKDGKGPVSTPETAPGQAPLSDTITIGVADSTPRNEDGDPSVKAGQSIVFNVSGLPSSSTGHIDYINDDGKTISSNFSTNDTSPQPSTAFNFNPDASDVGIWTAQVTINNSTKKSDELFFEVTP